MPQTFQSLEADNRQLRSELEEERKLKQEWIDEYMKLRDSKRPVAWRVKDFADGWIMYQDEARAYKEAEATGAAMQGLYVRDGS